MKYEFTKQSVSQNVFRIRNEEFVCIFGLDAGFGENEHEIGDNSKIFLTIDGKEDLVTLGEVISALRPLVKKAK